MKWLTDLSIRRPWPVLLVLALLTALMASGLGRLQVDPDVLRDLPEDLPARQLYDRVGEMFPSREMVFVGIESDHLWTPEGLRQVHTLTRALEDLPVVQQVVSPTNATVVVGTAEGMEIRDAADPFPETAEAALAFRDFLRSQENLSGLVVSEDGAVAAMMVFLQAKLEGTESQAAGRILEVVEGSKGDLTVWPAGRPMSTFISSKTIGKETGMLSSAALLLMVGLLAALFLNVRGVLLPVGVVVGATLWTMGGMGWAGFAMTHSTEALPIMLIAIGVADGVHLLQAFMVRSRTLDKRAAARATMEDLRWPVIMTSLTSMAGFLALNTSGVGSIMMLGGLTAFGILVALLLSLTFIPAMLALLPAPKHRAVARRTGRSRLQHLMVAWGDLLGRRPGAVTAAVGVLVALALAGATRVQVETSVIENFAEDHPIRQASDFIDAHFSGVTNLQVVFEGAEAGAIQDPAFLQRVQDFTTWVRGVEGVGGTSSILPVLRNMNQVLHQGDPAWNRLPGAVETERGVDYQLDAEGNEVEVPVVREVSGREVVTGYLSLLEMSGKPGDLANFVTDDYRSAKVTLFLTSDRKQDLDRVVSQVRGYLGEHLGDVQVEMTGMAVLMLAVNDLITRGQGLSIGVSLLLVFVLTAALFRSPVLGLYNVVPLFVALFFNFGVMGLLGLDLNLMTMGVSSMAIGVGVDYGIHFVHRYRVCLVEHREPREALRHAMAESGVAILMNMVAVAGGFLTLLFASFKGVMTMGLLISLIMAFSAIGALTILPLLFLRFRPAAATRLPGSAALGLLAVGLLALSSPARAEDGRAFMASVLERQAFRTMVGTTTLTLTSANGGQKVRVFKMASRENAEGEHDMILFMEQPADMRGNAFLMLGHRDADDERYVYVPALHRVNRIVGAGRKGAFMSSDFSYDDIGSPDLDEWTWTLGARTTLEGHAVQEVTGTPATEDLARDTGLSRVTWFVDVELKTARAADYYDRQGLRFKRMEVRRIEQFGGIPFATDMVMTDLGNGHTSRMTMDGLTVDGPVDPTWFTKRALQNGF